MTNYKIPTKLLSGGNTNAKTQKNELETYVLYLAPHKQNSKKVNLCPKASKGCAKACLFSSGRGRFSNVIKARVNKTEYYINNKKLFIGQLAIELLIIADKATKQGKKIAVRLNGTSDVDFIYLLKKYSNLDVLNDKRFANVIFYDYTAILGKVKKYIGTNYHLTLSRKENNQKDVDEALNLGANVSIVFKNGFPNMYKGYKVKDADKSDLVMINNKNVVLALSAKGKAKHDKSGFVIDSNLI